MKARSLSVFRTRLRVGDVMVKIGDVIEGDADHLRALARNGLVELMEEGAPNAEPTPGPTEQPEPAKGKKAK